MDDFILELPNFVPEAFCKHLIKKFESDDRKKDGMVVIGSEERVIPELKNSEEIFISDLEDWEKENQDLRYFLSKAVIYYNNRLKNIFKYNQPIQPFDMFINNPMGGTGYSIQKQKRGSKYAWHFDGELESNDRPDAPYLFMIMYLNTLEPHEGGQTEFSNGRKIRPECGKIMMCPASWTFPHCGNEVKADNKYILTVGINLYCPISPTKS